MRDDVITLKSAAAIDMGVAFKNAFQWFPPESITATWMARNSQSLVVSGVTCSAIVQQKTMESMLLNSDLDNLTN